MKKIAIFLIILLSFSLLNAKQLISGDKVMHFTSSAFITCWNYGFSRDILDQNHQKSLVFAVSLTGSLGFGKEVSDKHLKKTYFSWKDITFDLAGIALGMIIINNTR
ncbi:MAG: hypothetical protein K8S23_15250 [Candidatus Cloacimonetes bacterium]|nr:hypothetical protein [Candidatus Cloacimonadota bacterium]